MSSAEDSSFLVGDDDLNEPVSAQTVDYSASAGMTTDSACGSTRTTLGSMRMRDQRAKRLADASMHDPNRPQFTRRVIDFQFFTAVGDGDLDAMSALLDAEGERPDVNACTVDYRRPLHIMAEEGDLAGVELIVSRGADVNVIDRWGMTPLSCALLNRHFQVVHYLRASGASVADLPAQTLTRSSIPYRSTGTNKKDSHARRREFASSTRRSSSASATLRQRVAGGLRNAQQSFGDAKHAAKEKLDATRRIFNERLETIRGQGSRPGSPNSAAGSPTFKAHDDAEGTQTDSAAAGSAVSAAEQNSMGVDDLMDHSTLRRVIMVLCMPFLVLMIMQGTLRLFFFLLFTAIYLIFIIAFFVSEITLRPPWYHPTTPAAGLTRSVPSYWQGVINDPMEDLKLPFDKVEIPVPWGKTSRALRGWWVPASGTGWSDGKTAVVFVHGGARDRRAWLRHTVLFYEANYHCLLFDLMEHGISDGTGKGLSYGQRESRDAIAAVKWVRANKDIKRIVICGTSVGGAAVLIAAAHSSDIDIVIAENPMARAGALVKHHLFENVRSYMSLDRFYAHVSFDAFAALCSFFVNTRIGIFPWSPGKDPIDIVSVIGKPVLYMHGTSDEVVPWEHSQELFDASEQPKELWLAEGCCHCMLYDTYPLEFQQRVMSFIQRHEYAMMCRQKGQATLDAACVGDDENASPPPLPPFLGPVDVFDSDVPSSQRRDKMKSSLVYHRRANTPSLRTARSMGNLASHKDLDEVDDLEDAKNFATGSLIGLPSAVM